jgi:deoxyribonuclease-4
VTGKPLLGAHVSSRGALVRALERSQALEGECFQIFTRAPGMWRARAWKDDEVARFRAMREAAGNPPLLVHDIYLTNLASPPGPVRERSIATLIEERQRCAEIGADGLVCHMGAHLDAGVDLGLARYAAGLREVLERTAGNAVPILLENSAGQGTCLGHDLGHIAEIFERVESRDELAVCLDTCHLFAAGYDLRDEAAYERLWTELDARIGLERLRAFHLNDSKRALNCRVDRHEHIGAGEIGADPFRRLLTDPRMAGLPMVIELPDDNATSEEGLHRKNLELLRRLRSRRGAPRARGRKPPDPRR